MIGGLITELIDISPSFESDGSFFEL
jgi:hypothetical protein